MFFYWDPKKNQSNIEKHGVGFDAAHDFDWSEDVALVAQDTRKYYGERRYTAISYVCDLLHVLVFTPRPGGIRIISLRLAN